VNRRRARDASGPHSRQSCDLRHEIFVEQRGAPRRVQVRRRDADVHDKNIFGMKTESNIVQRDKTLKEQAGAGEEHDGQCDFRHYECAAQTSGGPTDNRASRALLERLYQIHSRCLKGRRESKEQAHNHRNAEGERKNRSINSHFGETRNVRRSEEG
jgi:hypothetical protein